MKNKSNSDDNLPLKKTLELYDMIIAVRSVFHEGNKNYPQAFLDKYMFKLSASRANQYINNRIDVSEGIDVTETQMFFSFFIVKSWRKF